MTNFKILYKKPIYKFKLLPLNIKYKQNMKKTSVVTVFLFTTLVIDTSSVPWITNIFANFRKKSKGDKEMKYLKSCDFVNLKLINTDTDTLKTAIFSGKPWLPALLLLVIYEQNYYRQKSTMHVQWYIVHYIVYYWSLEPTDSYFKWISLLWPLI